MTRRLWHIPGEAASLFIAGARVVDPAAGLDGVADVLVKNGRIAKVGADLAPPKGVRVIDAGGLLVLPGFVDLHCHLRVPGREDEEDFVSASAAAAAGGYVAVFGMANTDPVVDTASVLGSLTERAAAEATIPCGFWASVTRGLDGERLTEMAELSRNGAVGFSDDGRPLSSALLVRRALQYSGLTDRPVGLHAETVSLAAGGVMHEGAVSARLGLTGIPSLAESLDVGRAAETAAFEGAWLHVAHVSTAASIDHIVRQRERGATITCEVTPHHLALTDAEVASLDANLKMNPPLRPEAERRALVAALCDGTIDCVATDHAPHARQEKDVPFEAAAFGTIGLETAFAVIHTACVATGELPLSVLVERMSQAPARIAGIPAPTIATGAPADLCLVDPHREWVVERASLRSRSDNSAWLGRTLTGKVVATLAAGCVVAEDLG
jgi:dihydroorotase